MDEEGVVELWPTRLMQRLLPDANKANPVLSSLILRMDAETSNLTTDYLAKDLLQMDHPALQWLKQCINKTVIDYLHAQRQRY